MSKTVVDFEPRAFGAPDREDGQRPGARRPGPRAEGVDSNVAVASDAYDDLVKRGRTLVGRIRRQQSTKDAVAAAETTVTKAKTTRTQATKAAKKTTTAAKTAKKHHRGQEEHRPLAQQRQGHPHLGQEDRVVGVACADRRRRQGRRLTDVSGGLCRRRNRTGRSPAPGAGDLPFLTRLCSRVRRSGVGHAIRVPSASPEGLGQAMRLEHLQPGRPAR